MELDSYCVIDIYGKYVRIVPLKHKKPITITNAFQKNLDGSGPTPNKIWVYQGSEFYNRSVNSWLYDIDIEMYLTHNKGNSVVTERFIRTFKTKT